MIPMLEPLFQGEWAPFGETLRCSAEPPADAVPVASLIDDPLMLRSLIERQARSWDVDGKDLRAAASAWSLSYLWSLLPPVVAGASILQHVFPVSAREMHACFGEDGACTGFHVRDQGVSRVGSVTAERYGPLLHQHLRPLFEQVHRQCRLPMKILWGNAARYLELLLEEGMRAVGETAVLSADRQALLVRRTGLDGNPNPLAMPRREISRAVLSREVASGPAPAMQATRIRLHRQCCLYYRLPGQPHCDACPLAPDNRF